MHIAVLSAGLTSLSSAFHLARRFPLARITVIEKTARAGGWVRSSHVEVDVLANTDGKETKKTSILVEHGPRTIRAPSFTALKRGTMSEKDMSVLEMINMLSLTPHLRSRRSDARYLYLGYEGKMGLGLVKLPSTIGELFFKTPSSLRNLLVWGVATEPFRVFMGPLFTSKPVDGKTDDPSLHSLLSHHFGPRFARVMGSAIANGVYNADSRALSVASTAFKAVLDIRRDGGGSIVLGIVRDMLRLRRPARTHGNFDIQGLLPTLISPPHTGAGTYTFTEGMQTLPDALVDHLNSLRFADGQRRVQFLFDSEVTKLDKSAPGINVTYKHGQSTETVEATHVVSALPMWALSTLLNASPISRSEASTAASEIPYTSLGILTALLHSPSGKQIHPAGFGYLVPRSPPDAPDPNNLSVIGVIFEPCEVEGNDNAKVSVMFRISSDSQSPPDLDAILETALKHLGHTPGSIDVVWRRYTENKMCIPTPVPARHSRSIARILDSQNDAWDGRLEIVGAAIGGVSIGECILGGRRVGLNWKD